MNIVQLTPGAGAMFCGNCLRDNALVGALRALGHQVVMVPMYLPLTLDEPNESADIPIFFNGVNVYLEQKSSLFRHAPGWLHDLAASPRLLRWAAGRAAKTRAADLGDLTLSMLQGELGNQAREIEILLNWLKTQPRPDVICLSNAMLVGLGRRLKQGLGAPIVCTLQGEDTFLDGLPEPYRSTCWKTLGQRASELDLFIAPSQYFADRMRERLGLPADRVKVVYNGINLEGYQDHAATKSPIVQAPEDGLRSNSAPPVLGFFARMCREKGLDTLVEAFIRIRESGRIPGLKLHVGGSCGPTDQALVDLLRERLRRASLDGDVSFFPNLDRAAKIAFLRSLSIFSVPAAYGEAFGLYIIEALAAGVPVVQPKTAAFPELVEATGGGVICPAGDVRGLASAIEELLLKPEHARALGASGRQSVMERFSAQAMTRALLAEFESLRSEPASRS